MELLKVRSAQCHLSLNAHKSDEDKKCNYGNLIEQGDLKWKGRIYTTFIKTKGAKRTARKAEKILDRVRQREAEEELKKRQAAEALEEERRRRRRAKARERRRLRAEEERKKREAAEALSEEERRRRRQERARARRRRRLLSTKPGASQTYPNSDKDARPE